jgi:hypothetical protein
VLSNIASADIKLTDEDLVAIEKVQADHPVLGSRYFDGVPAEVLKLWG